MAEFHNFLGYLFGDNHIIQIPSSQNTADIILSSQAETLVYVPQVPQDENIAIQLEKILNACNLSKEQVVILTPDSQWANLRHIKQIKQILLFGITGNDLGININIPLHYPLSFDNRTWIVTQSIEMMQQNPSIKSDLWNQALKPYFSK